MGVYIIHQILIQHILVFSFLLEKSIMDGVSFPWKFHPPLSTSFMSLSPSSVGFMIFGLLMSGISSCLTSINFWVTILNLRSYYLTLKTVPLFPWALLITAGMLLLTLPNLSGACFSSLVQISIPSREVSILCSYLDIILLFSSYVYLIFKKK